MIRPFGILPDGTQAALYTITCGPLEAAITDYGAALVELWVPDPAGNRADIVLGQTDAAAYSVSDACLGATVGRNANRVQGAQFPLNGKIVKLTPNENTNNLHSGPSGYQFRIWQVADHTKNAITFALHSPDGDQGFPGNANIRVTYTLSENALTISYDAVADKDTVFNLTNHSYFNMAGHENTNAAMDQLLTIPGTFFNVANAESIPTGELRNVEGSPMDFRTATVIGARINEDYDALILQNGYDHNWQAIPPVCCRLEDPVSHRAVEISTDCPGIQVYAGNFLNIPGKNGVFYHKRSGVALETQFYPNSVNHPEWPQPFTKAGEHYRSATKYTFTL